MNSKVVRWKRGLGRGGTHFQKRHKYAHSFFVTNEGFFGLFCLSLQIMCSIVVVIVIKVSSISCQNEFSRRGVSSRALCGLMMMMMMMIMMMGTRSKKRKRQEVGFSPCLPAGFIGRLPLQAPPSLLPPPTAGGGKIPLPPPPPLLLGKLSFPPLPLPLLRARPRQWGGSVRSSSSRVGPSRGEE